MTTTGWMPRAAVQLAVRLLPASLRGRYREQWNADLRDAAEAGIPQPHIARGALALAATVARPLPWSGRVVTPEMVARRGWLAAGLALSSAVLGLSWAASVVGMGGLMESGVNDYLLSFGAPLAGTLFAVAAPISAAAIVSFNRGVSRHIRLAVWLLVLASCAPFVQTVLDRAFQQFGRIDLTWGTLVYPFAIGSIVVALVLMKRQSLSESAVRRSGPRASLLSVTTAVVTGGLLLAFSVRAWIERVPLEFSWAPSLAGTNNAEGELVIEEIPTTTAMYEEWLAIELGFERAVNGFFIGFAIATLAIAVIVGILVALRKARPAPLVIAAVLILFVAHAAVLTVVTYNSAASHEVFLIDALLLVGRAGLVTLIMFTVGGVRFTRATSARTATAQVVTA